MHLPFKREQYQKAQAEDPLCSAVTDYCKNRWPDKKDLEDNLVRYCKSRSELTLDRDNLLLHGKLVVVPKARQREALEKITYWTSRDSDMQTSSKCVNLVARTLHELENLVKQCPICAQN